jgi:hypothetical protein
MFFFAILSEIVNLIGEISCYYYKNRIETILSV